MDRRIKISPVMSLIVFQEKLYYSENEQPYEKEYSYIKNYIGNDYIIIGERFFECFNGEVEEYGTNFLFENTFSRKKYFYVNKLDANDWGDGVCVYYLDKDNHAHLFARKFVQLNNEIYKIGNFLYHITDKEMTLLCKCVTFDMIGGRIEAYDGEFKHSAMKALEKVGNNWEVVAECNI